MKIKCGSISKALRMIPLAQSVLYKYIKLSTICLLKIFISLDQNCSIRYKLQKNNCNIISENGRFVLIKSTFHCSDFL